MIELLYHNSSFLSNIKFNCRNKIFIFANISLVYYSFYSKSRTIARTVLLFSLLTAYQFLISMLFHTPLSFPLSALRVFVRILLCCLRKYFLLFVYRLLLESIYLPTCFYLLDGSSPFRDVYICPCEAQISLVGGFLCLSSGICSTSFSVSLFSFFRLAFTPIALSMAFAAFLIPSSVVCE